MYKLYTVILSLDKQSGLTHILWGTGFSVVSFYYAHLDFKIEILTTYIILTN